jgi:hypothetical protein
MPPLACISEALRAIGGDGEGWEPCARMCETVLRALGDDLNDAFLVLCAELLHDALSTAEADRRLEVITVLLATQHTLRGDALKSRRPA